MKLLTKQQRAQLLKNGKAQDGSQDFIPVVKWFTPDGGCSWLISEIDPHDPDLAFGLCDLGVGFPELGSVSIAEIERVRGKVGLPVERDLHFTGKYPLSVYADAARRLQQITLDKQHLEAAQHDQVDWIAETQHKRQDWAGQLVDTHVLQNQTALITDYLPERLDWNRAIENRYNNSPEAIESFLEQCDRLANDDWHELPFDEREQLAHQHGFVPEAQEVYEWWLVSEALYHVLKEFGHPVVHTKIGCYWGRTCTGQAIKQDRDIKEVARQWYGT